MRPKLVSYETRLHRDPGLTTCPSCQTQVTSLVTYRVGLFAWFMCFVFVFCGWVESCLKSLKVCQFLNQVKESLFVSDCCWDVSWFHSSSTFSKMPITLALAVDVSSTYTGKHAANDKCSNDIYSTIFSWHNVYSKMLCSELNYYLCFFFLLWMWMFLNCLLIVWLNV